MKKVIVVSFCSKCYTICWQWCVSWSFFKRH